jgi:Tfp pilus assembly protein PilX
MIFTKRERFVHRKASGSALIITLLVLVAMTLLGMACIQSGIIELKISSNERQMRENFLLAESAAMEGVQRLAGMTTEDLNLPSTFWHHSKLDPASSDLDFRDPGKWHKGDHENQNCLTSATDPTAHIAIVQWKVSSASSLVMTENRLYQNRVYGLCSKHGADNLVEIGFNLRY